MVVMAHGLNTVLKRGPGIGGGGNKGDTGGSKTGIGSRRIFPPHFKLQVLDSYRNDADCKGNQRATARKYGIHRRQIQKWLQAESNLRNSVVGVGKGGSKTGEVELALRSAGLRQRDDPAAPDAYSQSGAVPPRVPAVSPDAYSESAWSPQQPTAALDFTTHSRTPPCDLSAPIDLSLKRPQGDPCAPVYVPPLPAQQQEQPHCLARLPPPAPPTSPLIHHTKADPDIWDLSTKPTKRKHEDDEPPTQRTTSTTPKPVKLFKPYLDDLHDTSSSSDDSHPSKASPPLCCGGAAPVYHSTPELLNNNIYEYTYTLHELQPTLTPTSLPPSYYYQPLKTYSTFCHDGYDEATILQPTPLKQRQSYSLDFKLRAIECYYQDEMCRGNQRAVASKYNIHRRQVQKWLKQEEELRQRNESVKFMHTVR